MFASPIPPVSGDAIDGTLSTGLLTIRQVLIPRVQLPFANLGFDRLQYVVVAAVR